MQPAGASPAMPEKTAIIAEAVRKRMSGSKEDLFEETDAICGRITVTSFSISGSTCGSRFRMQIRRLFSTSTTMS